MTRSPDSAASAGRSALSRRRFLSLSIGGLVAVEALLVACQSAAPSAPSGCHRAACRSRQADVRACRAGRGRAARPSAPAAAAAGGGTLVVVSNSEPNPLETSLNPGLDTSRYVNDVYDRLIDYDLTVETDTPPLKPSLATEWSTSNDGLTYTFKLRPGVTFHDGTPWDAAAAKFNIDRVTQPNFEFYFERGAGASKSVWGRVKATTTPDPMTLQVELSQPYASFTDGLALTYGSFASPTAIKANGNDNYPAHASGTGPFKFVQQDAGVKWCWRGTRATGAVHRRSTRWWCDQYQRSPPP